MCRQWQGAGRGTQAPPPPQAIVLTHGQWHTVEAPCRRPEPDAPPTWEAWPHLHSRHKFCEAMWAPAVRLREALGLVSAPAEVQECSLCSFRGDLEQHLPSEDHFKMVWSLAGDDLIDREEWFQTWRVQHRGFAFRFNLLDGEIQLHLDPAPGGPGAEAPGVLSVLAGPAPEHGGEAQAGAALLPPLGPTRDAASGAVHAQGPGLGPGSSVALGRALADPAVGHWLRVGAEVDAWFWTEWHPARIRRLWMEDELIRVEVLWDEELSASVLVPEALRPRGAAGPSQAPSAVVQATPTGPAPGPPRTATDSLAPVPSASSEATSVLARSPAGSPDWTWQSLVQHGIHGAPAEALVAETITPSDGFLLPHRAADHPWICHMCCKKFVCADTVQGHLNSKDHRRKRQLPHGLTDWILYNIERNFYELPLQFSEDFIRTGGLQMPAHP